MEEALMKSGTNTLASKRAEVAYISRNGLILRVKDREYYLSYADYPWFERAAVSDVFDVQLIGNEHIRWEKLDVDLSLSILRNPEKYPLVAH